MGVFSAFVKMWWKEIFIAAVVVGAVIYVHNLRVTVEKQATTIAQMELVKSTLVQSNKTLTDAVQRNSKALAELGAGAAHTKEEFVKLNAHVVSQTRVITDRLGHILNQPVPATCDDTITYMKEAVPTYGMSGKAAK